MACMVPPPGTRPTSAQIASPSRSKGSRTSRATIGVGQGPDREGAEADPIDNAEYCSVGSNADYQRSQRCERNGVLLSVRR